MLDDTSTVRNKKYHNYSDPCNVNWNCLNEIENSAIYSLENPQKYFFKYLKCSDHVSGTKLNLILLNYTIVKNCQFNQLKTL